MTTSTKMLKTFPLEDAGSGSASKGYRSGTLLSPLSHLFWIHSWKVCLKHWLFLKFQFLNYNLAYDPCCAGPVSVCACASAEPTLFGPPANRGPLSPPSSHQRPAHENILQDNQPRNLSRLKGQRIKEMGTYFFLVPVLIPVLQCLKGTVAWDFWSGFFQEWICLGVWLKCQYSVFPFLENSVSNWWILFYFPRQNCEK